MPTDPLVRGNIYKKWREKMDTYKNALEESGVKLNVDKIPEYTREYIAQGTFEFIMRVREEMKRKAGEC